MILRTQNIFLPHDKKRDGFRLSVLPTHLCPKGGHAVLIKQGHFAMQLVYRHEAVELFMKLRNDQMKWGLFEYLFRTQLQHPEMKKSLTEIAVMGQRGKIVTLLSDEVDPQFSVRRIVAEECSKLVSGLKIEPEVVPK